MRDCKSGMRRKIGVECGGEVHMLLRLDDKFPVRLRGDGREITDDPLVQRSEIQNFVKLCVAPQRIFKKFATTVFLRRAFMQNCGCDAVPLHDDPVGTPGERKDLRLG